MEEERKEGDKVKLLGFEVLTSVVMRSSIFWDITPCGPLKVNRRFGGTPRFFSCLTYSSTVMMEATCSSGSGCLSTDYTAL
jgi:hypothetical protein